LPEARRNDDGTKAGRVEQWTLKQILRDVMAELSNMAVLGMPPHALLLTKILIESESEDAFETHLKGTFDQLCIEDQITVLVGTLMDPNDDFEPIRRIVFQLSKESQAIVREQVADQMRAIL